MENNQYIENQTPNTSAANSDIRQKLINRFVEKDYNKFNEIMDSINAGDIKLAHRLAHTLKSTAGQLALTALQKAAEIVERQLKNGMNLLTAGHVETLKTEMEIALRELSSLYTPARQAAAEPLSREAAYELLQKIEPMLEDYDTECMAYIGSLRLIPGTEILIGQIEDFAFEAAFESVNRLKAQI